MIPSSHPPARPHHGRLTLFTGPMFSGKSRQLIHAAAAAGPGALVLKPAFDTRDPHPHPRIHSRDGTAVPAVPIHAWPADRLSAAAGPVTVVVVDELQFLVPPHYDGDVVRDIAATLAAGISVIAGALDTDYRRAPFDAVERLRPLADEHHALRARCHRCAAPARWTAKKRDTGTRLEPGDAELYEARCDRHWAMPVLPP